LRPLSVLVLQVSHELEYAAYGFFAPLLRSLLYFWWLGVSWGSYERADDLFGGEGDLADPIGSSSAVLPCRRAQVHLVLSLHPRSGELGLADRFLTFGADHLFEVGAWLSLG
jgi:hypothetical protein